MSLRRQSAETRLFGGERGIISYLHVLHPFGASFAVHKTAGASFEHHAMRDGLEGEPQGCGE